MEGPMTSAEPILRKLQANDNTSLATLGVDSFDIRLILVPDASTSNAVRLAESSWAWLSIATESASIRAQFYEYQYSHDPRDASVWQALNDSGDVLLDLLLELDSQAEETPFSVILVSNGLGGLPAKKALTRLSERYYDPAARRLLDKLSQVIIIGCPHPTINHRERWSLLDYVLRHERKLYTKMVKAAAEEAGIVANLCSKFREAGIHCPVLTTFESQPMTLRHGPNLLRSEKRVLVGHDFAETGVRNEKMVLLDLENRDMRSLATMSPHTDDFKTRVISALRESNERQRSRTLQRPVSSSLFEGNLFESTVSERSQADEPPISSDPAGATFASTVRSTSLGSLPAAQSNETRKSPRLPCYILGRHPRNPNFFGRSDVMRQIDSFLLPRESPSRDLGLNALKSFAICGLGGMGKTQIALEYAFSRRSSFDAIFWVQADAKTNIAECFGTIAISLGIAGESEVSDLAVSFSIVMQWLVDPVKSITSSAIGEPTWSSSQASWLIIFDNADTMELVSEFWPSTGSGSVLITTRDPAGKDFCLGCGTILHPLPFSETVDFFISLLNKDSEIQHSRDSDLLSLLTRFGGLPLAIVQVASLIRRRSMTISEFSRVYERGVQEAGLAEYQASQHDGHYHHSLFTVWAFESLDGNAQSLLNVMSLLDPFNIQESVLNAERLGTQSNLYPDTTEAYVTARSNLLKASLITRHLQSEQVELHPLVQEVVQARMTGPQIVIHFSIAVTLVHASWPSESVKWGHETSHREQSGQLLPHALKLKAAYEKRLIKLDATVEGDWIELLKDSGWYLYERGEHDSALPIFHLALDIARRRSNENPALLADMLMCLAALGLHTSSPHEVLNYSREHLQIRQQVYDRSSGDPPMQVQYDLAMGFATMAMAYIRNDQFEEAVEQSDIALKLYRSFPMYRNWRVVPYFAVAHAGWALWSLGRYQEAEELLSEAANADKLRNAGPSYGLAGILLPLGNVQSSLGKHKEAAATHEAALEMFYAANGNNYKTAQARLKVADHRGREGRVQEAWQNYELAIVAFSQNKYYKPELARARIKAARFRWSIGDFLEAKKLLKLAQSTLEEASIAGTASVPDEDDLAGMVRIWSR